MPFIGLPGPLSKESSYRQIVSNDLGPKEIGKLANLLQAYKTVLPDEDEEAANWGGLGIVSSDIALLSGQFVIGRV